MIIDDDPISLAVLTVQAEAYGHHVLQCSSGDHSLRLLPTMPLEELPDVLLVDMQMPGLAGEQLAVALRMLTGPATLLLAMSASGNTSPRGYDGFLRKPWDQSALKEALNLPRQTASQQIATGSAVALQEQTFAKLKTMMSSHSLLELYQASLADTRNRITVMLENAQTENLTEVRREAHAIKGSAGMIGATQISDIAARIELEDLSKEELFQALDRLTAACSELERVLDDR